MRNTKDFGQYIAKSRKALGMTQEAFATLLGITPQAISKWENGIGYPDVALFPAIAKALNISIESLFVEQQQQTDFPPVYRDLPFVFAAGEHACYSSKAVASIDDGVVTFTDGSTADPAEGVAYNRGAGEIVFYEADEPMELFNLGGPTELFEELDSFDSLSVLVSCACTLHIYAAENNVPSIKANGSHCFVSSLRFRVRDNTLTLSTRTLEQHQAGDHNTLDIAVDFNKGRALRLKFEGTGDYHIEPDFDEAELTVCGSGCIRAAKVETLTAVIHGSGDIVLDEVSGKADCTVHGSGDMVLTSARNVTVRIHGSGDFSIGRIDGYLNIDIHGSGDITAAGELDTLTCRVVGNGTLSGHELTVRNADLCATKDAHFYLKHITGTSIEKLSRESRLVVGKRG